MIGGLGHLIEDVVETMHWVPHRAGRVVQMAAAIVQVHARHGCRGQRVGIQRAAELPPWTARAAGLPVRAVCLRGGADHHCREQQRQERRRQRRHFWLAVARRPRPPLTFAPE
jgi:hypothetical protein